MMNKAIEHRIKHLRASLLNMHQGTVTIPVNLSGMLQALSVIVEEKPLPSCGLLRRTHHGFVAEINHGLSIQNKRCLLARMIIDIDDNNIVDNINYLDTQPTVECMELLVPSGSLLRRWINCVSPSKIEKTFIISESQLAFKLSSMGLL